MILNSCKIFMLLIFTFCFVFSVSSQTISEIDHDSLENSDVVDEDFFSNAGDVIVKPGTEDNVNLDSLLSQEKVRFSGSVNAMGAAGFGWKDWLDFNDLSRGWDADFYYTMGASASLEANPSPRLRMSGSVSTSIPVGTSFSWPIPAINSLYLDYTIIDNLLVRLGKFDGGMGQGRLLNPGNYLSGLTDGLTMRFSGPLGPLSAEAWVFSRESWNAGILTDWRTLGVLGKIDASIKGISFGLAGFYQKDSVPKASAYLKSAVFGVDVAAELIATMPTFGPDQLGDPVIQTVVSTFWEGLDPKLRVQADWSFDSSDPTGKEHVFAVGIGYARISPLGIQPALSWNHIFADNSGQVILGAQVNLAEHLGLSIGVPITYGEAESRAVAGNGDPGKRRVLLAVKLDLSGSY